MNAESVIAAVETARERKTYLGGPDIAAILGKNSYSGPYDVWLKKTQGLVVEMTPPMEWGLRLEGAVALKWAEGTGHQLSPGHQIFHPEFEFLGGTPDFFCLDDPEILLEIKTSAEEKLYQTDEEGTPLWGDPGTDEVPVDYLIQCQYYLGLSGRKICFLPVFFLGARREFRTYRIDYDPEIYTILVNRGKAFWEKYVVANSEPPIDASPSDLVLDYLAKKALRGGAKTDIPPQLIPVAIQLEETSFQRLEMERQEEELKAILLASMAENGIQKYQGSMLDSKFSISIIGSEDDEGKPIVRWDLISEELSKRLKYPEIPSTLIAEKTIHGKPKKPYLRPFFNAVRASRKKTPTLEQA